ncbi:MAG: hypothetical protein JWM57_1630, partial [Phycisphaerales bacterium]|nr:hypothetical protein [Phycisphaerales bacterium]
IVLSAPNTLGYPDGGHVWVFINWALGFKSLGHEVMWLDVVKDGNSEEKTAAQLATMRSRLAVYGLGDDIVLCTAVGEPYNAPGLRTLDDALSADLLCNHRYDLAPSIIKAFKHSMLVDIDPGQLQQCFDMGTYAFIPHTSYFTVGEWPNFVKTTPPRFNQHGVTWHYVPPPVALASWPVTPPGENPAFTTVSNWFMTDCWMPEPDDPKTYYDNSKRTAFEPYLNLPKAADMPPLELSINLGGYQPEIDLLEGFGWRFRESRDVSDPSVYRRYIQNSLGEFSSAKASYIRLNTGWLSDRTASYLASGKPAVVLKTGESQIFPDFDGICRFTDPASAERMLRDVMKNYDHHCKAARQIAEAHLDARKVLTKALEVAVAS